jgi:hypothetical protein
MTLRRPPRDADRAAAQMIRDEIISVHHFPRDSTSQPGQPPAFSTAGPRQLLSTPTLVGVYDVWDRTEQDKIVSAVYSLAAEKQLPVSALLL